MKMAAVVLALIVVVAVVAVVAMPRDVSVEKEGDGTLSFEGEKSLRAFGSLEIDIQPGDGCFAKVFLDGDEVASDVTSYRYDAPFADFSKHEIKVVFGSSAPVPEPDDKVTLTVQAGNGGTVDPEGSKKVVKGSVETLEITPDNGYVIDEVKIDGQNVSVCNILDVKMDGDRIVSVSFRPVSTQDIAVTIDVDAKIEIRTTGGEIDFGKVVPSGEVKVRPGSSLKVSILLNPGFEIEDFKVDGKSVGKVTEYTIENIQKSVDISISVIKNVDGYTIKASAGNGGKISPSGDVKIEKGKDATFTFSANSGYAVSDVTVDGRKVVASGSYIFKAVSGNHSISVSFKYVGGGGGGSVTPSKTLTKIEVTQQPYKTGYWSGESFDASGMEVTARYSDGSSVLLADGDFTVSPLIMANDTTGVVIAYKGVTCEQPLSVSHVTDLTVEGLKDLYEPGEKIELTGVTAQISVSDGTTRTENPKGYAYTPEGELELDDTKLSVTYRGFTREFDIIVAGLDSITASTTKDSYLIGEKFDRSTMTVTAIYKNTVKQVEKIVTDYTMDPESATSAGKCTVTITYKEKTITLNLNIVDGSKVGSISVTAPTKIVYFDDTVLDKTGMTVTGKTVDSATIAIPISDCTFSESVPDEDGKVAVTVTYNKKTDTFDITRKLEISSPADLEKFRDNVNGGKTYENETVSLMVDIDLKNKKWTPIGLNADDDTKKFMGTFDGGSHKISNLKVDLASGYTAAGFFGALGGTLKNLTVDGASIKHISAPNTEGNTDNGIAVVSGSLYPSGSIENVTVKNATVEGNRYVGGIAGYVYGSITECIVEDVSLIATPDDLTGKNDNGDKVGGIAGYWCSENIHSLSNNSVSRLSISAYRDAGGIVGAADAGMVNEQPNPTIKMEGNTVDTVRIVIDQSKSYGDKEPNAKAICGRLLACSGEIPDSNKATGFTCTIGILSQTSFIFMASHAVDGDTLALATGNYTLVNSLGGKTLNIRAAEGADARFTVSAAIALHESSLTFENLKFVYGNANYVGLQHTEAIKYTGCTIEGKIFLYGKSETFEKCKFVNLSDYNVWTYGASSVFFSQCEFECAGKAILIYKEGPDSSDVNTVLIKKCTFDTENGATASAITNLNCAAIETDNYGGSIILNTSGNTVETGPDSFSGEWRIKKYHEATGLNPQHTVTVNGIVYDSTYLDGKELTIESKKVTAINGVSFMDKEQFEKDATKNDKNLVINLTNDVVYDIDPHGNNPIGGTDAETITINGNGHALIFRNTDSDWNCIDLKNKGAKLILNNLTLDNSNHNSNGGPWNSHDLYFKCNVEMNDVVCTNAVAFQGRAVLNNVTVSDPTAEQDTYMVWIVAGSDVTIKNSTIDGRSEVNHGNRAIKIGDQYVGEVDRTTVLNMDGVTFLSDKYAAILVTNSKGSTTINVTGTIDISKVAQDKKNLVWTQDNSPIILTTGYTYIPQPVSDQGKLNGGITGTTSREVELKLASNTTFTLDSGIANTEEKSRDVTFVGDGTQTVDVVTNAITAEGGELNYQRGSTFTFKNLTIQAGEGNFDGVVCDELTYIDCTIKGNLTLYGKATFINCTFENTMANQYSIWTWGGTDVKFENCTFNTNGKAILLYGQATEKKPTNLVVKNCIFNDRNNGTAEKAAIEIGNDYNATYTLTIENTTVNGFAEGKNTGSILWANKNSMDAAHLSVTIDGKKVQ